MAARFPLFKGATRVPTVAGVPLIPAVVLVITVASATVLLGFGWLALLVPGWLLMAQVTRTDDRAFRILWLWGRDEGSRTGCASPRAAAATISGARRATRLRAPEPELGRKEQPMGGVNADAGEPGRAAGGRLRPVLPPPHADDPGHAGRRVPLGVEASAAGPTRRRRTTTSRPGWRTSTTPGGASPRPAWRSGAHVVRRRVRGVPAERASTGIFCRRLDARLRGDPARRPVHGERAVPHARRCGRSGTRSWRCSGAASRRTSGREAPAPGRRHREARRAEPGAPARRSGATTRSSSTSTRARRARLLDGRSSSWRMLVNGERLPMPVCRGRFGDYLVANRPLFGRHGEVGELRLPDRRPAVRDAGGRSSTTGRARHPGDLDRLLGSSFEFVLSQSFSCALEARREGLPGAPQAAAPRRPGRGEEPGRRDRRRARPAHVGGSSSLGRAPRDAARLRRRGRRGPDHLAWARSELLDRGIVAKPVDLALEAAFWAQLPGNCRWRPRPMAITSQNFLCFSPFHNFMSGKPVGNPWGPAVTVLRTVSGTPLYFNFHASPAGEDSEGERLLGNTVILGQSSAGQDGAPRLPPRAGAEVRAHGGRLRQGPRPRDRRAGDGRAATSRSRAGEPTGWNPLQLEPTSAQLLFLKDLVKDLVVGRRRASSRTTTRTQELEAAVDTRHDATSTGRPPALAPPQCCRTGRTARTRAWRRASGGGARAGSTAGCSTTPSDMLDLGTHRIYGFDITEFLDYADVRGPMMKYLIYRTEAMLDGRRFIYVFDEWWRALSSEDFAELTKNKGKTIRKQDGFLVLSHPGAGRRAPEPRGQVGHPAVRDAHPAPEPERRRARTTSRG